MSPVLRSVNVRARTGNLVELLAARGIRTEQAPVYLMRHADRRYPDMFRYIGTTALTQYQSVQKVPHEPGGVIVAFYGNRGGHGLLLGAWRIEERFLVERAKREGLLDATFEDLEQLGGHYHRLTELDALDDVRLKLEVEWRGEKSWRRRLRGAQFYPFVVTDGCPVKFEGKESISLVMSELRIVLGDPGWKAVLGAVSGVYLITNERSGEQYVGSATGGLGVLQRWSEYAATGHGGNKKLKEHLSENANRVNDLRFTLLEALPRDTPRLEALRREGYWKIALGSRTHGLNLN